MKYILDESPFSEAERILKEHHEKFKNRKKRCLIEPQPMVKNSQNK